MVVRFFLGVCRGVGGGGGWVGSLQVPFGRRIPQEGRCDFFPFFSPAAPLLKRLDFLLPSGQTPVSPPAEKNPSSPPPLFFFGRRLFSTREASYGRLCKVSLC